jgi:hypothetical protein
VLNFGFWAAFRLLTVRNPELYFHIRTDKQRIAKYKAKTDPATVSLKLAAMHPIMKANYAPSAHEAVTLETRVHDFIAREQVPLTYNRPSYLNFARQLYWKGIKRYSGVHLVYYAQSLKDKWLFKGLNNEVLKKLALDLFDITLT